MPLYSPEPQKELCVWPAPENYEGFNVIYKKVAPAFENRVTIEGAELAMSWNTWGYLPRILTMPILSIIIAGDTNNPWQFEAHNRIPSPNKKCFIATPSLGTPLVGGRVTHMTYYTDPSYTQILSKPAAEFLADHLVRPYRK